MIDTIKLRSPFLSEDIAFSIERTLDRIERWQMETGEVLYGITSGMLEGSYDHQISIRLEREDWVVDRKSRKLTKDASEPYVVVEGSVHKALMGHNCYGGPCDVQGACRWFVCHIGNILGVPLPDGLEWQIRRIDWAEVFDLGRGGSVELLSALSWASYPLRSVRRYGNECVLAAGDMTTIKAYLKGPEFSRHDFRRLANEDINWASAVQADADRLIRVEVGVKGRKLDTLPSCYVGAVTEGWLRDLWRAEVQKLVRESQADVEVVRTAREVKVRLYEVYGSRLAKALYGTWLELSSLGDSEAKLSMSRRTYYRQRAQLSEAGVSWFGGDVQLKHSLIPMGFSFLGDDCRLTQVSDTVVAQLREFSAVAA